MIVLEDVHVYVNLVTMLYLMVHVYKVTVKLINTVVNAKKTFHFVFNVELH